MTEQTKPKKPAKPDTAPVDVVLEAEAPKPVLSGMVKMEVTAPAAWDHAGVKHLKGATPSVPEHVASIWEERHQGKRV